MIDKIKYIPDIFRYINTITVIIAAVTAVILWVRGILPVLLRLGNGLAKGKIAIFAKGDNLTSLIELLKSSGLFSEKNFIRIIDIGDFPKAKKANLYLIFFPNWNNMDSIKEIMNHKNNGIPLIVYAPPQNKIIQDQRAIPSDIMAKLNEDGNTIVTNFKGRLLNDIIGSLITGNYEK
ncbi:hypothetical protein [Gloeothece verrucosa]|uniref:Uncharacterized protein n=1 Tax=Gloeothece verrucosa (strain PCC 7822) TaxID=497965 RepID=E0UM11_GLOV7|nr:hypothetical protein [Gloeothece verrucosa]ADN17991.1 conserved hypothetical protein [Gloeothece verrucosa PCC 7822]